MRNPMARTILVALLALWAWAPAQTLDLAVDQSPVGLDPHLATAFSTFAVIEQIYEALVEVDADLRIQPALAESWEISDDGRTYAFTLRPDVTFHDGSPFTARDVVASFERLTAEETGSPLASRFTQVESVEAVDDATVEFRLSEPFAPFLGNLLDLKIVPDEALEAQDDLQRTAVGTGPFMLEEWVPDTYLLLRANPDYYREGQPVVEALQYHIVPEASTRAAGLRTGTYEFLPDVDPATAEVLRAAPGVELLETQDLAYSLLGLNTAREPLDDPRVREAINVAIDREEIVEAVYFGNAVPGGPLSPGLSEWAVGTDSFGCYEGDAERARELLAEAGYPDGFEMDVITFGTNKVVSDLAQVLQAQLRDAGIDASVEVQEFGTFVQNWRNSEFDAFVSLNGGAVDPDGYLYRTFRTGGSTNVFNYSDPAVDELLDRGQTTVDPEARREIYAELQNELACTGPVAHIAYGTLFTGQREGVEGFLQIPNRDLTYLRATELP